MKLRNKKTGEIVVFGEGIVDLTKIGCKNVAEMMEAGWEDYEEPKDCWFIDPIAFGYVDELKNYSYKEIENVKELGFDFDTKEEAEKAVEKLKAWKRLKEKGFKFTGCYDDNTIEFVVNDLSSRTEEDLGLLFGGEE